MNGKTCTWRQINNLLIRGSVNSVNNEVSEFAAFKDWYIATLNEKLTCISHERQAYWSEAIAEGDVKWLEKHSGKTSKSKARVYPAQMKYFIFITKKGLKNSSKSCFYRFKHL